MKPKTPSDSRTVTTDLVLPSETNHLSHLFGGALLAKMDRAAYITARRHSRRIAVTASVSRAFKTSMEIFIDVFIEDRISGERTKANEAIYTFVAVDDTMTPVEVPEIIPETELEKSRYEAALRRKQLSLVLAGKMKPQEATELKAIFEIE